MSPILPRSKAPLDWLVDPNNHHKEHGEHKEKDTKYHHKEHEEHEEKDKSPALKSDKTSAGDKLKWAGDKRWVEYWFSLRHLLVDF